MPPLTSLATAWTRSAGVSRQRVTVPCNLSSTPSGVSRRRQPPAYWLQREGSPISALPPQLHIALGDCSPAGLLLREVSQENDPGEMLSRQGKERRVHNPYSTLHPFFDHMPAFLQGGYLSHAEGRYLVTPDGRALIERIEQAEHDYVATLTPFPPPELARLAALLNISPPRLYSN